VILHEILHFLVQDHEERFESLIKQHLPGWPSIRQRLNEAPLAHAEWAL
jgi:hypothetical protein